MAIRGDLRTEYIFPPNKPSSETGSNVSETQSSVEENDVLGKLQQEFGLNTQIVNPSARRALADFSLSKNPFPYDFNELKKMLENLTVEQKAAVLNTFAIADGDPRFSNYLVYATRGLPKRLMMDFFQAHEAYLADIPVQASEIQKQLVASSPGFSISVAEIEEILGFRVKENIENLMKRIDYGEYGPEIFEDIIAELKDVPAQEQLAVHLFKIIARILEQENVELGKFKHFQQIVLENLRARHQTGMFNKTLERLGHLEMVPEVHWRVDRDSEEYNRRLGVDLNGYLLERAQNSESKEPLLEIGPGSGKAKKQRAAFGLADSYEDYALTNEVYFRVIWNLTKADKSAKMIIGKTLTNYHYGNIGTTGFGTIFSSGHI